MQINLSPTQKGYLFALISTISLSNVFVFSKAALNDLSLPQFGFYWFGFAIIWNLSYSTLSGHFKSIKPLSKFQIKNLLGIGLMEVIATVATFASIKIISNPTIPSMLRNLEPVFIVILASFFLKEKFNKIEQIGIILTLLGTVIISYNKTGKFRDLFIEGTELVVISCLFYAFRTIWSKKVIHHFSALALNLNKVVCLFFTSVIALVISGQSIIVNKKAIFYVVVGSLIGPFLTSFTQFLSFKFIDASRSTLVQSTTGFFTLIISYLFFGSFPFAYQIFGCFITIIGLFILSYKNIMPKRPTKI